MTSAVRYLTILAAIVLLAAGRAAGQDVFDAARDGKLDVVKRLCDADPVQAKAKNRAGFTPLHWAAIRGHVKVAEYLIDKGADVDAADKLGLTPLHRAAYWGHVEMTRLLLKNGADPKVKDREGKTPLDWALKQGHQAVVELLKDKKGT